MKEKIIQFGHKTLRLQAVFVPIKAISSQPIQEVISNLKSSLPENGVGLAAPQINHSVRIFIADIEKTEWRNGELNPVICINPKIMEAKSETAVDWEGCLSAPGLWGQVTRPDIIKVAYYDEGGTSQTKWLSGVGSRVFQHELDHLDGILFVDRMVDMSTLMTDEEFDKINAR